MAQRELASQAPPPSQSFSAVHTFLVRAAEEKQFIAAVQDINGAIAKAGCPSCIYRIYKVSGDRVGPYNYLQISEWPSGDIYTKVHNSAEFAAAQKRQDAITGTVYRAQIYNRYVEVKP